MTPENEAVTNAIYAAEAALDAAANAYRQLQACEKACSLAVTASPLEREIAVRGEMRAGMIAMLLESVKVDPTEAVPAQP